ncbi:MAG: high frequency lysogenization protein HflD [Chloroflexota bacterium]
MLLVSLLVAFWFGAGHALSPGHGKTVVAAYLVGSKGTARQAVLLGLTVTATHTIGVFALGLVTLYLSSYIVPDQLYPWLGFASGMLVALMGLTLFVRRFRAWYTGRSAPSQIEPETNQQVGGAHTHSSDHHHGSQVVPNITRGFGQAFATLPGGNSQPLAASAQMVASVPHGFGMHTHSNGHHHAHDVAPHQHGADAAPHRHGPFGRAHTHAPIPGQNGERVTLRSLLMLGVSGGLLPCPSALIVLLAAIAFHRVAFGMLLIVTFSLGLATVLTGIGILMVYGGRVMGRLQTEGKGSRLVSPAKTLVRVLPIGSALLVAAFGTIIALSAIGVGFLPAL